MLNGVYGILVVLASLVMGAGALVILGCLIKFIVLLFIVILDVVIICIDAIICCIGFAITEIGYSIKDALRRVLK